VRIGLVPSLSRPGGNLTGIPALLVDVVAKRLQLLHVDRVSWQSGESPFATPEDAEAFAKRFGGKRLPTAAIRVKGNKARCSKKADGVALPASR
jgi:hypothetical protein